MNSLKALVVLHGGKVPRKKNSWRIGGGKSLEAIFEDVANKDRSSSDPYTNPKLIKSVIESLKDLGKLPKDLDVDKELQKIIDLSSDKKPLLKKEEKKDEELSLTSIKQGRIYNWRSAS